MTQALFPRKEIREKNKETFMLKRDKNDARQKMGELWSSIVKW